MDETPTAAGTGFTEPGQARALARIAYEAYAAHQCWKNYQGLPIPPWADVRADIQAAWAAAVAAVQAQLRGTP